MKRSLDHIVDDKRLAIEAFLDKWDRRFPLMFDELIYKEKDRLLSFMERGFIVQRSAMQLAKLAYKIRHARRRLAINSTISSIKEQVDFQLIPMTVEFPLGAKAALGVLAHANIQSQYEHFHKKQVLTIVQKVFPDIQVVIDSLYEIQPPRTTIQTVYFEICKQSGCHFSLQEINQLKHALQKELPYSIEKVIPNLFTSSNDEELFKNIVALDKEIRDASDPPQVIIALEQQTLDAVDLSVLVVYVHKDGSPSLKETLMQYFANAGEYVQRRSDRWESVRYVRQRNPVEAGIIKLRIDKRLFPLRNDGGLHFHLVRQKISQMITAAIGPFRDYNGGLLSRQMSLFEELKEAFLDISQDVLENFYFSLAPFEAKAMLSITLLKPFFEAFLAAKNATLQSPTDCFVHISSIHKHVLVAIRTPDRSCTLDSGMFTASDVYTVVSYTIADQGFRFYGYLIAETDADTADSLRQAIAREIEAWTEECKKRQILRINIFNPAVSFDPRIGGDKNSSTLLKMLFEGLMRRDKVGALEYGIAQDVSISPDQKTYTFTLKKTFWSNGTPVTAKDFEYAWKTALSPSFKTSFAYLFYPIKNARLAKNGTESIDEVGVHAIDDYTLVVELEFPASYFLESTALTVYSPISYAFDRQYPHWPQYEGAGYICNGAFCLADNNLNEQYVLGKNHLYWDCSAIPLDEVIVVWSDRQTPFEMFRKGLIDWTDVHIKTKDSESLPQEGNEITETENTGVYWIVLNTKRPPFHNKKLRKALSLAINRQKLQDQLQVIPAVSPIPAVHSQLMQSVVPSYSLEQAREVFDEALKELGFRRDNFPPIHIIHTNKHPHSQVMAFVKEEWEKTFGIRCELKALVWNRFFSELSKNEFQVRGTIWEPWIDDPIYTLNAFIEGGHNPPNWIHQQYRDIVYLAEKEPDLQKRLALYALAEKILVEEMPIIPLIGISSFAIKKKNLKINSPLHRLDFKWCHFG